MPQYISPVVITLEEATRAENCPVRPVSVTIDDKFASNDGPFAGFPPYS